MFDTSNLVPVAHLATLDAVVGLKSATPLAKHFVPEPSKYAAPAANSGGLPSNVLPMRRRWDKYGAGRPDGLQALLMCALDEIDYGMVLLDVNGNIGHANHMVRAELQSQANLAVENGRLVAAHAKHREALDVAIAKASRGTRSLVDLSAPGGEGAPIMVAVVPVGPIPEKSSQASPVLVITGKQQTCEQISLQFFAQRYGLSRSEQAVMVALAQGFSVVDIAKERGLAESTVRSQVKDVRLKTRCKSVRELMGKLSALPPLVSSIKGQVA